MSCSRIENTKYVNFQAGRCLDTVIAECVIASGSGNINPTVGDKCIFSIESSAPAEGITLPLGTVKSAMREMNRGFNTSGDFTGATIGNEQLNDKTGTSTYREDFSLFTDNSNSQAQYKDILQNSKCGNSFNDGEGNTWKVIGTIGNKKEDGCMTATGTWKYFFHRDNKYISPQDWDSTLNEPRLVKNFDQEALLTTTITTMSEFKTNYAGEEDRTIRFSGCIYYNPQWNENGDFNTITVDYNYPCDARIGNDFYVNEVAAPKASMSGYVDISDILITSDTVTSGKIHIDPSTDIIQINSTACKLEKTLSTSVDLSSPIDGALIGVIVGGEMVGKIAIYTDNDGTKAVNLLDTTTLTGTIEGAVNTVTGTGTKFTEELGIGDFLTDDEDELVYRISAIASDTSLTTSETITVTAGSTITRVPYIIKMFNFDFDSEKCVVITSAI